jgi:hypothetical protein
MRKSHDPLEEFYSFHPTLRVGGQWRTEVEKVVNKAKKSEDKGNPRLMSGFQWEDQKNSTQIKETENGGELLMRVWPVSDPSGDSFVSFEIKPGSHIGLYSRYVNDLFKESPDSRKESRIVQSCKKPALLRFPKDYDDALEEISKKSNPLEIGVDRFIVERGELLM